VKSPVVASHFSTERIPIFSRTCSTTLTNVIYQKAKRISFRNSSASCSIENTQEVIGQPPVYKDVMFPTAPMTELTAKCNIVYSEVRENVRKLEEMVSGDTISGSFNIQKVQDDVLKLWSVVKSQPGISQEQKNRIKVLYEGVVRSLRKDLDPPRSRVGTRSRRSSSQFLCPQISGVCLR